MLFANMQHALHQNKCVAFLIYSNIFVNIKFSYTNRRADTNKWIVLKPLSSVSYSKPLRSLLTTLGFVMLYETSRYVFSLQTDCRHKEDQSLKIQDELGGSDTCARTLESQVKTICNSRADSNSLPLLPPLFDSNLPSDSIFIAAHGQFPGF